MKFACEQCKTRYSIADERVRGKVLKIRCKHCSHIITVRDEGLPPQKAPEKGALERAMDRALSDSPSLAYQGSDSTLIGPADLFGSNETPPSQDPEEWHISIDGVATGPLLLSGLASRAVAERGHNREVFVWRDGFDDWLPPEEVQEVRAAMESLRPQRPRAPQAPPKKGAAPAVPKRSPSAIADVQQARKATAAEPVDQVESFEFSDSFNQTPPTATFVRTVLPSSPPAPAPVPSRALAPATAKGPRAFDKKPPPLPFEAPPSIGSPISTESINVALANLPALGLPGVDDLGSAGSARMSAKSPKPSSGTSPTATKVPPAPRGDPTTQDEPLYGSGSSLQFNISEPSQLIDLSALAGAMQREAELASPAADQPAEIMPVAKAVATPAQVVVMAGPAPAAFTNRLRIVLGLSLGACALLLFTVAYLLMHRGDAGRDTAVTRRDNAKQVWDRPVSIVEDPRYRAAPGETTPAEPAARKNGNGKRPPKLPAAAAGKEHLPGNVAALAKLYEEGGGSTPALPASRQGGGAQQGGGVSEAELQDVMRRNQKSLSACYDRVLKHDESLRRGRIDVQVRIGISGTVTHVNVGTALGNTELTTCLQQTIRRWHFPPSDSDYETQFPLLLTAN